MLRCPKQHKGTLASLLSKARNPLSGINNRLGARANRRVEKVQGTRPAGFSSFVSYSARVVLNLGVPNSNPEAGPVSACDAPAVFATTRWSMVLAAGHSSVPGAQEALEKLCRAYWYPLYVYVRRQGQSPQDAQDLTQEFFARLLEKKYLRLADPERGKFRAFLLKSLQHFLVNEWEKARAQKRGGGQSVIHLDAEIAESRYAAEPVQALTLDQAYEKRWAVTLIETVVARLRESYSSDGRLPVFEDLKRFIWGEQAPLSYAEAAAQLGLSEGAVKVAVHRLRARYRELLRAEIAETVATPGEVDEELEHLISVLTA
jgi:RNA polymerase sigma factor (sigma-70 family)